MKYFIDSYERELSGHENYVEFRMPGAKKEFWVESSLYMPYDVLEKSRFSCFLEHCMHKDILFDSQTISGEDWSRVLAEAERFDKNTYDVICELRDRLKNQFEDADQRVGLIWESDRVLARRRAERDIYPVRQEFYEEVRKIDESLSFEQREEQYERLLDKYGMPSCFYPLSLHEPSEWD